MSSTKRVNLALQGGGSHGAFTWGVLDALIEDGRLAFEAVSGTSAGAMNAAILLQGWSQGGGPGARAALARLLGRARHDGGGEPDPAHPARSPAGQLEPRRFAGRAVGRPDPAHADAMAAQSAEVRPAARAAAPALRRKGGAHLPGHQGLRCRHQRADRQGPHLHARGAVDRRPARLGLPAQRARRRGDRRRALLGRRLPRQPADLAVHLQQRERRRGADRGRSAVPRRACRSPTPRSPTA